MSDDVLIKVDNVSKKFCRSLKHSLWYGVQDVAGEMLGHQGDYNDLRPEEFWAVNDVSFELKRGECLGLIGRNGAGKTTLLRMLNGLINPDAGRIQMRGQVGALIALGAGFNPILTGRENIYVNASVLGLSKRDTDARINDIINFAEIGEFINMPVQSYSSGMAVRLGFAIASSLDPDILILDEVLAVGDVGFRTKCYNRIYDLAKRTAIIFVSHNMPQIARLSTNTLLLESGKSVFHGEPSRAIELYNTKFTSEAGMMQIAAGVNWGNFTINGTEPVTVVSVQGRAPFVVEFEAEFPLQTKNLEVSLSFHESSQELTAQINNRYENYVISNSGCRQKITIEIPALPLGSGQKLVSLAVVDADNNSILLWAHTAWKLSVSNRPFVAPPVIVNGTITSRKV